MNVSFFSGHSHADQNRKLDRSKFDKFGRTFAQFLEMAGK